MSKLVHEELYRGRGLLARLATCPISVCGAGALGSNLVESLARCGAGKLTVIDRDRVAEHNLSTQPYGRGDIGAQKATALSHWLFRACGTQVTPHCVEMKPDNVKRLLRGAELVIDCFDNSESRQTVSDFAARGNLPCLHVGLSADFAEILWNAVYRVPQVSPGDGCDYPLARNIVQLAVATASEVVFDYLAGGKLRNYTVTLKDLSIQPFA